MASPHPLNQAVVAQALHDLRNGQLRRCQAMGFSGLALAALKHPALVSVLVNAQVAWCSIKVNSEVIERLLEQVRDVAREIEAIDRLLKVGASTEMLAEFHGLSHQEVALRRQVLGLPVHKGRWPVLTEAQDAALWQRWSEGVKARGIDEHDTQAALELAIHLAESTEIPLAVIWAAIGAWTRPGSP
ncbi:MAG: DUF2857 domain-containing protein [Steroidobacteraceae bacterium]